MHKQALESQKSTDGMVDYDRNSAAQQQVVVSQDAQIRRIAGNVSITGPQLRIVDYGCGPGRSAIAAVKPAVEAFRSKDSDCPIVVCHADQPGNDWNALFELVYGPDGYHQDSPGVRTEASVGTFYDPMVSPESVDVATCFAASHWLSHAVQLNAPGTIWFADLEGAARTSMAELAARDWVRLLSLRADELKPGGYLFISTLASIPDASEINGTAASGRGIYRALQIVAQGMADDGLLDQEVLDRFVFGLWFLTADEARKPIENDSRLSRAFEIDTLEVVADFTDLFADKVSDPDDYANSYTGYIRAFADTTLRTQLFGPSADGSETEDRLADKFYERLTGLYRTDLTKYAFELWHLTVILRRR